jgi:Flp pilus assembly protein TadD
MLRAAVAVALGGLWTFTQASGAGPSAEAPPARSAAVALARVDSFLAVGAPEQALPLAQRAFDRWGEDPLYGWQVMGRSGAALRAAGRPAEALPRLEQAVRLHPGDAGLHHQLGLTLSDLGRNGRALAEFEQAAGLEPRDPAPHLEAGRLRGVLGDWRRAGVELEVARGLCGGCPEADRLLGSVLMAAGRPADAVAPLARLWAAYPDSQVRHHLLGALAGAGQDSATLALVEGTPPGDRTRDDWRMAVQAEGRAGGARWSAAALAVGDSASPGRFPGDEALFWAQAALNLLAAGLPGEALQAADRALALDDGQAVFHHNRAAILVALGRQAEARRVLEAAGALETSGDREEKR